MTTPPFADPLIGKTVAHYEIVAKLGGGGMGVVYRARDTKLGRPVALKFLPPQWTHDENAKQRFVREAQAASATDHAHICTIHDIGTTDDGQLFIVMAYYEGQTLKQRLESGASRPEVEEALRIAGQVAEGLMKAHAQGVVHRDVKPGNLMLTDNGVKILDFGLAKFADSLQLTIAGSTLGTVAYMSPEQARGEEADARSDIWALGVVLYEMLAGELPFKGAYPEAISYAIKNDAPPPLVGRSPQITEEIERVVFRALQKNPDGRYQSARELAYDLRVLQGYTIPLELRPEVQRPAVAPRRRGLRPVGIAAALAVLGLALFSIWITRPVNRVPVAIAGVVNQTGYSELDPYRLALTETLVDRLAQSPQIRVLAYERWLQIVRRFLARNTDVSSREAVQALAANGSVRLIVAPTLLYESNAWRARAEIRNAETATNVAVVETAPVVSSLAKDTAYSLMESLTARLHDYFRASGPVRVRIADRLRGPSGDRSPVPSFRSLDAAAAFEQGMNAYERLEYDRARTAFRRASELDSTSALAPAWVSRVALLMRQDDEAVKTGDQAVKVLTPRAPDHERLFVEAVSAESRRDMATAAARYENIAARYPDDPSGLGELGGFQDRRGQIPEAIATYRRMLGIDSRLVRPHLELCRLYNRVNEAADAKTQGDAALTGYQALDNGAGRAQALLCLADRLRLGRPEERAQAKKDAQEALKILLDAGDAFNVARAQQYLALTEAATSDLAAAAALWEQSLAGARQTGNRALESLDLLNLGSSHTLLGRHVTALEYYRQGQVLSDALGDERRAVEQRANAAAILIDYSDKPGEGLRDIQNATGVFRQLGDHTFEVFSARVTARSYWYGGRHVEAERELNRGIALAKQWNLDDRVAPLTLDLAQSKFELGDYPAALELANAAGAVSEDASLETRIHVARTHLRLGDFERARAELTRVSDDLTKHPDAALAPTVQMALGELNYETGNPQQARERFASAAALWVDALPDVASVESRSWVGFLDGLGGRQAAGLAAVQSSLDQARKMGRVALEARCHLRLARIYINQRAWDRALEALKTIGQDNEQHMLGHELQAQIQYWRGRALAGLGQDSAAIAETSSARTTAESLRASLSNQYRETYLARPDIGVLFH